MINIVRRVFWWIRMFCDCGSVNDGSVCEFSRKYFDVHDYPIDKGGDGIPSHFHVYTCQHCGKSFSI